MKRRVKEDRQALIQIFRRWWRNTKCAPVVDHRITTKRNAADANQDFNPELRVCIILDGHWSLVWMFQPAVGPVVPWNCNSKKRLAKARGTQGDWKGSVSKQCLALQPPGFSAKGLLPKRVPDCGAGAEEISPAMCPLPQCRPTLAVLITFLSLDPGRGCCRLSAFRFTSQSQGKSWGGMWREWTTACSPLPAGPTGLLSALPADQADTRSPVSMPGWDMPWMSLRTLISLTEPSVRPPGRAGLAFSAPGSQPLLYPADHTAAQQSWLQMLGQQLQSY